MVSEEFFEQICTHFGRKLPFVVYKKPNEKKLRALLQKDASLKEVLDFTESGFIFVPFDTSGTSVLFPFLDSISIETDYDFSDASEPSILKNSASQDQKTVHISLVKSAIDEINRSDLKKVVVSRKEEIAIADSQPISIFKRLLTKYQSAFVYCWYHPKVGLWLGATPETLLGIEGNRLSTMALAGTQRFIDTEDVIWQDKEKNEQQLVTDFIVGSLELEGKEIQVSKTKTVIAGNLLHLKTDISATFKPETLNLKHILNNLHPTPAICGLPKEKAKQFIIDNEDYQRSYYSGFLGELNIKEKTARNLNRRNVENNAYKTIKSVTNLYVNLRCMQLKENTAMIYIGGGITKDSDPEKEWEETVSKSETIKSIL